MQPHSIFRLIFVGRMLSLFSLPTILRSIRAAALLFLLILSWEALLPVERANAQIITDTLSCGVRPTIDLGAVLAGGNLLDSLYLFNSDDKDSVFHIQFTARSGFSTNIINPLRLRFGTLDYATTITFSDTTIGFHSDSIIFTDTSGCSVTFPLSAEIVTPDTNNSYVPLKHTLDDIIAFKTNVPGDTLDFQFQNNFDSNLFIDRLALRSGTNFKIISTSVSFPDTLRSDSVFDLKLAFTATKPGFYSDFIGAPNDPILPIAIQGLLQPSDVVQMQPTGSIYFSIFPNPSPGELTIHPQNISKAHVTISDVLGRVVIQSDFSSDWIWNSNVSDGTYFVTIAASTIDGFQLHEIHRIVVLH